MNTIELIEKAISFIEKNLLENIGYEDAAEHVNMSRFHFHRMFTMITGVSFTEYVRNRRLSCAGQELIESNYKIIDLAFKYLYDSPESFTRAFTRYHGVTPSVAKKHGAKLKLYNRLLIKIEVIGGNSMEYRIEKKEAFKLLAKVIEFDQSVFQSKENKFAKYWKDEYKKGTLEVLKNHSNVSGTYALCTPITKESDNFIYGIAKIHDETTAIPEGYIVYPVESRVWAVFECIGDSPTCVSEMWDRIIKEFLPSSEYDMQDEIDFEYYPDSAKPDLFCELWIPVRKKN